MSIWTKGNFNARDKLRQSYVDHYAHVRAVVPKERMFEFEPEAAWEQLCAFLGKPVPAEPYPHSNQPENITKMHSMVWWYAMTKALQEVGGTLAAGWGSCGSCVVFLVQKLSRARMSWLNYFKGHNTMLSNRIR